MTMPWLETFSAYWSILRESPETALIIDMAIALLMGLIFGYERSYNGRAAGIRTYGLVCMVSAALTALSVHPNLWISGHSGVNPAFIDPTRTIQGIMTGIGFLGAGIIMQNGMKISGLTTAASIWAAAAIGTLVGMEFYLSATAMTLMALLFVTLGTRFDSFLPSRRPVELTLKFKKGFMPTAEKVETIINPFGYRIARNSLVVHAFGEQIEWRFVAMALDHRASIPISALAEGLPTSENVDGFYISRARN